MAEIIMPKISLPDAKTAGGSASPLIHIEQLSLFYGTNRALKDISLTLGERIVTAFIGPSGCGKSTLLRCLKRMNDLIDNGRIEGAVKIGADDSYPPDVEAIE